MKKLIKFIIIVSLIAGIYYVYSTYTKKENVELPKIINKKEDKKLQIFDENSNERMIAVMINNNHAAWPHAGLDKSVINYEILAEGGVTRIMAIYKGNLPEKIGSIRSSRHYYLDYALENDAIYVHWGGSPFAYSDIDKFNIDNIDAMYSYKYFYRDTTLNKAYEHTGFSKGSLLKSAIENNEIRSTSNEKMLFKYSKDEIIFNDKNSIKADNIEINYSGYQISSYEYDKNNKVYLRSMSNEKHVDAVTGKQYTAKNIIIYKLPFNVLDSKGRIEISNIGSGEGYFITNGYAKEITWEKTSRKSQTIYRYKDNNEEIILNDGNTWIQIMPENKYLGITSNNDNIKE